MKKYWKSISIAVITIVSIGFFYIQSAVAGSDYPKFEFETISGDEEEVEDLIIYGDYREGNIKGDNFQITAEGTRYNRDISYLDRIDRVYMSPEMKQLQENYKGFMRGKHSIFQMAENEKHLAFADVTYETAGNMEFQIEVLDKDSNETAEFSVDVPDKEEYSFLYVEQVLIAEDKLKVVTRTHVDGTDDDIATEIHVYDFDIGEQTLENNETIFSYSEGNPDQIMTNIYTPGDGSNLQSNSQVIFILEQWKTREDEEGIYYSDLTESKVISIDMDTNEYSEFELSDQVQDISNLVLLEDSTLYFTQPVESGLDIIVYDMENQELDENRSVTIERDNLNVGSPLAAIKNGKIYIASYTDEDYSQINIFVVDVQSGEIVYEGLIEGLNGNTDSMTHSPYIHMFEAAVR